MPVVIYNGAFILDNASGRTLLANYFQPEDFNHIFELLLEYEVYPIIYSHNNETERFSYLFSKVNAGARKFLDMRRGDARNNPVSSIDDLRDGMPFYITCIDEAEKLYPIYKALNLSFSSVYHKDIYTKRQWLEIMPPSVNKASAVLKLKELLGCGRIVSFGDGINDIPMFKISDERYAVKNAAAELKAIATDIIDSNDCDGVAKWLLRNTGL